MSFDSYPNKWCIAPFSHLSPLSPLCRLLISISGIRLSASSLSSKFPVIKELSLSFNPLTKGATRILSYSAAPSSILSYFSACLFPSFLPPFLSFLLFSLPPSSSPPKRKKKKRLKQAHCQECTSFPFFSSFPPLSLFSPLALFFFFLTTC